MMLDFRDVSVLCIGDLMLDRFAYSDMERISPEAPVPILRLRRSREMLGGAGNVASNVASLGGRAILIGMLGRDAAGDAVRRLLDGRSDLVAACVDTDERPTICKTRFIAGNQQIVRTDEESLAPLSETERSALWERAEAWVSRVGAVVLSDYGKGTLTAATIARLIATARAAGIPVFVDPKSRDFADYAGAACITPNLKELAAAAGLPTDDEAAVIRAATHVMRRSGAGAILATRSEKGMILVEADGQTHSVPARAREVFDVSGAGDTVIAALALCRAAGRTLAQAMHIANAAASVVVSKLGTATADIDEVMNELDLQDQDRSSAAANGLQDLDTVAAQVRRWKAQGQVVGFTNGCFDVLHPGHVKLLARARAECDRLVVALNTDASVRGLKGPTRPVNRLEDRAAVLGALRFVDCVVGFSEPTPLALIQALEPDILVKGADYAIDEVVGADLVQAAGGRVVLVPLVDGQSTTRTIERLRAIDTE